MPSEPYVERSVRALLAGLPDDLERVRRASVGISNWSALLECARGHGAGGVVLSGLRRAKVDVPKSPAADLERLLFMEQMRQDILRRTLQDVLTALAAARVPNVNLKGPLLAARLYDTAEARPSTDLDILVDPSSLETVTDAMRRLGYVLEGGARGQFFHDHHHHVHFHHRTLPLLELHLEAYRGFGTRLAATPLLERAIPCDSGGFKHARVLSLEDELVYLAVHGASHRFERLSWLYDLKLLCRAHPELRWDLVAARAAELRVTTVVALTVRWLAEWLGADVDPTGLVAPIGEARLHVAERFAKPGATHLGNAVASLAFTAVVCDPSAVAAFGVRYVRMKLVHEARLRLRIRFAS